MRLLNNERGGALLLVLFGLILVTMFAMFQLKQIVTVRQQIEVAEVDIDARNIANMGLIYFMKDLRSINACAAIKDTPLVELDPNHSFQIGSVGCKEVKNEKGEIVEITVEFKSTGIAFGKSIIENGSFIIE